jgi:hypothetical protein
MFEQTNRIKITKWLESMNPITSVPAQVNQQQANAGLYLAAFLAANVEESVLDQAFESWNKTKPDNVTRALIDGDKDGSFVAGMRGLK